ncbi:MAG: branched-chain amino acid aminotransferase [Planctomycetes bacterium]|nr:branched-chain amino acid aminotransferase [Planctomycetota bacterium]
MVNPVSTNIATAVWNDESGFVVSSELVLVGTIAVLGTVVGLSELSYGINEELEDIGSAIGSMNQGYQHCGLRGHCGSTGGSAFYDRHDFCDEANNIVGADPTGEDARYTL